MTIRISIQDGQLGRSRNTVAVGEPVAGLNNKFEMAEWLRQRIANPPCESKRGFESHSQLKSP